jgi:wyosine [tRNA(Phe)-imidazoG37] synthetase (radical SAM superfamily)
MGQCKNCNEFFPPEFMMEQEKCMYCDSGVDIVNLKNENGELEVYHKRQCIEDYKLFMKKLRSRPGVADALATRKVKFEPKGE